MVLIMPKNASHDSETDSWVYTPSSWKYKTSYGALMQAVKRFTQTKGLAMMIAFVSIDQKYISGT